MELGLEYVNILKIRLYAKVELIVYTGTGRKVCGGWVVVDGLR